MNISLPSRGTLFKLIEPYQHDTTEPYSIASQKFLKGALSTNINVFEIPKDTVLEVLHIKYNIKNSELYNRIKLKIVNSSNKKLKNSSVDIIAKNLDTLNILYQGKSIAAPEINIDWQGEYGVIYALDKNNHILYRDEKIELNKPITLIKNCVGSLNYKKYFKLKSYFKGEYVKPHHYVQFSTESKLYKLYDNADKLIGEWTTLDSVIKNAKQYLIDNVI